MSIADRGQNSGRTISPLGVRAASGPLLDFESSVNSVASVLQSNRTTKDCLDRLLSAVSCLVSSTLATSSERATGTVGHASMNSLLPISD